ARGWFQAQGRPASTQAGLKTAVLLNGTVALGVGTLLMTPDTPLLFFMAMMLWALAQLCCTGKGVWWLAIGFSAGLGFDSKYTALLPVAGLG
ncbi:glycosyltransferase family 39 protein, partial [Acetobacter senegalensis]